MINRLHPIAVSFAAVFVAAACMVPPANQGNTAASPGGEQPAYSSSGSGGYTCDDYCGHMGECGILDMYGYTQDDCLGQCEARWNDGSEAEVESILQTDCGTLQASNSGGGGGGDVGGYGGGGGTGQGCVMSAANAPVQDCPSGQECCGSHCWTMGKCGMPTGN